MIFLCISPFKSSTESLVCAFYYFVNIFAWFKTYIQKRYSFCHFPSTAAVRLVTYKLLDFLKVASHQSKTRRLVRSPNLTFRNHSDTFFLRKSYYATGLYLRSHTTTIFISLYWEHKDNKKSGAQGTSKCETGGWVGLGEDES